jgi:hypothetical protein
MSVNLGLSEKKDDKKEAAVIQGDWYESCSELPIVADPLKVDKP